jgi:hypothetical protein
VSKALDIGCGDILRNPFHADELWGVDVGGNLDGTIKSADLAIERIPFDNEYFDYVTAHDFLAHIPRVIYAASESSLLPLRRNSFIELMNEIHRVLKPGGLFLSVSAVYPHSVVFRDPTHVNFITEETFSLYFDAKNRLASKYGFNGAFNVSMQKCNGTHIKSILQKVVSPDHLMNHFAKNHLISVVIPVYNGEKYLSKTLDSLCSQSFHDFEAICINDCSTDSSEKILQDYSLRDSRIRVLKTTENLGSVSKVLNFALPYLKGGSFVYSSQDDLFSPDWLEKMYQRGLETGADAVIPEVVMFHELEPLKNKSMRGLSGDCQVQLTGREAMAQTLNWNIPGNALLNLDIIRKFGFEEFSINSDEYSVRKFFLHCNKVVFSGGKFLYRQDNDKAVTKKKSPNTFDWPYTQLRTAQLLQENSFPTSMVNGEIDSAISSMRRLKRWANSSLHNLNTTELDLIDSKILRFESRLGFRYPFSASPKRTDNLINMLGRLGRSIRKTPRKISKFLGRGSV